MLVACRLAGLSALEPHYADDNAQAQSGVEEQRERRRPRPSEGYTQTRRERQSRHLRPELRDEGTDLALSGSRIAESVFPKLTHIQWRGK
jgi:hypothetical protein